MASLVGFREQRILIPSYRADGVIASATAPQLILPSAAPRSSVLLQNTSSSNMWIEFGSGRAKATISNGVVTSIAVTNAGFGFSYAPRIILLGGSNHQNGLNLGLGLPGQEAPSNIATAVCVMTGTAPNMSIASITVTNGGSGYSAAPYVQILNDPNDSYGAANPYNAGAGVGFELYPGQSLYEAHSIVCTDAIAVFCATVSATYFCRYTV